MQSYKYLYTLLEIIKIVLLLLQNKHFQLKSVVWSEFFVTLNTYTARTDLNDSYKDANLWDEIIKQ